MQTFNITEARKNLLNLVKSAVDEGESYTVTVKGKPAVVIMSTTDFDALKETIAVLSDPDTIKDILRSEEEIQKGELVDLDDL